MKYTLLYHVGNKYAEFKSENGKRYGCYIPESKGPFMTVFDQNNKERRLPNTQLRNTKFVLIAQLFARLKKLEA